MKTCLSLQKIKKSHLSVVWTKVDSVINSFNKILDYEKVNYRPLLKKQIFTLILLSNYHTIQIMY